MIFNLFGKADPNAAARNIGHDELQQSVKNGAVAVVDVREPHEFAAGHIPGAVNLPLSRFDPADLPAGKPVALICQAGARSARALAKALAAGATDIRHYPGGMSLWRTSGGEVVR